MDFRSRSRGSDSSNGTTVWTTGIFLPSLHGVRWREISGFDGRRGFLSAEEGVGNAGQNKTAGLSRQVSGIKFRRTAATVAPENLRKLQVSLSGLRSRRLLHTHARARFLDESPMARGGGKVDDARGNALNWSRWPTMVPGMRIRSRGIDLVSSICKQESR